MIKKSFTLHFINHEVNVHYSAFFNLIFILPYINSFASLISALAAMLLIIIVHELGHAYFAKKFGCRVLSIDVYFGGGVCRHERPHYRSEDYIIAWGGILFQLALLAFAFAVRLLVFNFKLFTGQPYITDALNVLIGYNLFMMLFNLIPVRGLDGYKAWRLLPDILLYLKVRLKRKPKPKKTKKRKQPAADRDWLEDSNRTKGLKGYKK